MGDHYLFRQRISQIAIALFLGMSLSACATLSSIGSSVSWKEEVLLHDGNSIIVERTQTTDATGLREIGQGAPLSEETLTFNIGDGHQIDWRSDFGRGYQDNLMPLVLNIVNQTPYLLTYPTRCHAYNKWGRPNPPYVYFRHDGKQWLRIPLKEVPSELNRANLIIGGYYSRGQQLTAADRRAPYVSANSIQKVNRQMSTDTLFLRQIARAEIKAGPTGCEELVFYKGAWIGPGDSIGKRMMDRMTKPHDSADIETRNSEKGD